MRSEVFECIFEHLNISESECILMYLYVSFETGSKDTKSYKKIQKDTCIFLYLFVSFEPVSKDT